jgi:acetyl-CoA C-acetyltransferase/acetyl-CoA acyltransferase 2
MALTQTHAHETLVFLSGKRTPFGSNGGSLKDVSPTELGLAASRAALEQAQVPASDIDHVIFGNVLHSAADSIYTPRHIGLKLGIPEAVPALGINRLCGSGFQTIVEAFQQMAAGDMMLESLTDPYAGFPMAITAENLAEKYSISRQDADAFALRSQLRCKAGVQAGRFKEEIAPYTILDRKGNPTTLSNDEHPKPETTAEILAKLKAVFKKDGTVTAGNASGIVDGAASLLVSTESEAKKRGLKPFGRMISYGVAGCDPKIMGIGPAPAARIALKRAGMSLGQMDLVEVNEAFASQALAVQKELEIPDEVFNVNGGAIAIGHPLAGSGTRIIQTLLYELKRRGKRYGLGSACIGGGQGIAIVVEAF